MSDAAHDSPWAAGRRAAREVALPAALVLLGALALVVAYYHVPAVAGLLDRVGDARASGGYVFAAWFTALTSGLIPWLMRMALPTLRPAHPVADLTHSVVWWAIMGVVVSAFYEFLAVVLGPVPTPGVVVAKVLADMFGFTVLVGAPANALSHLWKDLGWDLGAFRQALRPGWYRRIVVPNLVTNWAIWGPGAAIFYSLPVELQLPVANAIGTCWALMCVRIAAHSRARG